MEIENILYKIKMMIMEILYDKYVIFLVNICKGK